MNRTTWLINRIRVISVREILFRLQRVLLQAVERFRVATSWQPLPAAVVRPRLELFRIDVGLTIDWQQSFQLDTDRLHEYMTGQINFFGHDALDVGMPVAWHRDPMTRIEAPRKYSKSINYRDDRVVGNIKYTWELGRHQHLVPLAAAYAVSGDVAYRNAIVDQIDGWINENPYAIGVHWCSALEVSLRLVSWTLIHSFLAFRDGEQGLFASVCDKGRLGISIYQQAYFVRHFLSCYSSANNHLIGELCGLWVTCKTFDLGEHGEKWSIFAREGLEQEANLQVYADGVSREQATYYHLWVLEYFFFSWLVGERSGTKFSAEFTDTILAMTRFVEDICPDGGEPPQFGDADDGFVARFSPSWSKTPFRELLSAIYTVFGNAIPADSEKAFWYKAMLQSSNRLIPQINWYRRYPVVYPHGGYIIMGGNKCHLVFDAGSLGYLEIAAHGHADALSFCLAVDGEWWLVDPGTYAYHSDPKWRSYFRGTAAHNTVRVNQENQSKIGGPFMWLSKANVWIDNYTENTNLQIVRAHHDGYAHLGIVHSRELQFSATGKQLDIVDTLQGNGGHTEHAEIYYHFAPEVSIHPGPVDHCWIATWEGRQRQLVIYTDPCWKDEVVKGGTNPIIGWYSPALEEKVPTNTLRGMASWSLSMTSITRIVIEKYSER